MSKLVVEYQYFGSINYIKTLFQFSNINFEVCESFQKMSFRNRMVLAGSNGLVHLSVPLEKGRDQKQLLKDVRISYTLPWQLQHWRTIESCYNRSPFFEYYRDWLEPFYQRRPVFLLDMNRDLTAWLVKQLKLTARLSETTGFLPVYPAEVTDFRSKWLPRNFQESSTNIHYQQVFADRIGFQPNLSILDLLFCEGPNSPNLLSGNV